MTGLWKSKFLDEIPPSPFFSVNEILLSRNRVDWSRSNSFRRVLDGGINYFTFRNTQNRRQIYIVLDNQSLTETATFYFPTGFWKGGIATQTIAPASKMLLRIISQDGQFFYQAITDMDLFTAPAPNTDSGLLNVDPLNASSVNAFDVELVQHNAVFYQAQSTSEKSLDTVVSRSLISYEQDSQGFVNPLVSTFLNDTRILGIAVDEVNELAYVTGNFDERFRQSSLVGAVGVSIVEVDLTNGSFSLFKASVGSPNIAFADGRIFITAANFIRAYDQETSDLLWSVSATGGISALALSDSFAYVPFITSIGSKNIGGTNTAIAKIDLLDGSVDEAFIDNQAPFVATLVIQSVLFHDGALLFAFPQTSNYAGNPTRGIVKLDPITGVRDLSIAADTGFQGVGLGLVKLFRGGSGFVYLSAVSIVASTYTNAGIAVPTIRNFFKVSVANGFADAAFNAGLNTGASGGIIEAVYVDNTQLILSVPNNFTLGTLRPISKANALTGVQDANYNPQSTTSSNTFPLLKYIDSIIVNRNVTISISSIGTRNPNNTLALIKKRLSDGLITQSNFNLAFTSAQPRALLAGVGAHADKIFVAYTTSNTGAFNFVRAFDADTLLEITGFPTINTIAPPPIGGVGAVTLVQDGDNLYVGGLWEEIEDSFSTYTDYPSLCVIDIPSKSIVASNRFSLPTQGAGATAFRGVLKMSRYLDRLYVYLQANTGSLSLSPTFSGQSTVFVFDLITGQVIGNLASPTTYDSLGLVGYKKGLFTAAPTAGGYPFSNLNKYDMTFIEYNPALSATGGSRGILSLNELQNNISLIQAFSSAALRRYSLDTESGVVSELTLPPLTNNGNLPQESLVSFVVPYVNYLSRAFASWVSIFNNKARQGAASFTGNFSDTNDSLNVLDLPTALEVESPITLRIKEDIETNIAITRNTVKAELIVTPFDDGVRMNPLTGQLAGRVEESIIRSVDVNVTLENPLGFVQAPVTVNIVDRAPWRNLAVSKESGVARIKTQLQKDNRFYVGGDFDYIGPVYNGLVKIAQGSGVVNPTALAKCHDFHGDVKRLLVDGNSLYAFGTFEKYGEFNYRYFVKINLTTGEADHEFMQALGDSFNGITDALNPVVNGQVLGNNLYIAGNFSFFDGQPCGNIISINKNTGVQDAAFNAGVAAGGSVLDIALDLVEGRLWVVGSFTSFASNTNARSLAVLSALTGSLVPSYFSTIAFNDTARRVLAESGAIYIVGDFTEYRTISHAYLVRVNSSSGVADSPYSLFNPATNPDIRAIALGDTTLGIAANAGEYDTNTIEGFLTVNKTTGAFVAKTTALETYAVRTISGNSFAIGGDFTTVNANPSRKLALVNGLTGLTQTIYSGERFRQQRPILDINIHLSELLLANSDAWELQSRQAFAVYDYSNDEGLQFNNAHPNVFALAPVVNKILIDPVTLGIILVGLFDEYDSVISSNIARLLPNGNYDTGFNAGTGFDAEVVDAVIGTFYANTNQSVITCIGSFTTYNSLAADKIVSLSTETGTIGALTARGVNNLGTPNKIVNLNNTLIAVSGFSQINGNPVASFVARMSFNNVQSFAQPVGLDLDANNRVITDAFKNLYVFNLTTIKSYSSRDNYSALVDSVAIATIGAPAVDSQGNYLTLAADLGQQVEVDATQYGAVTSISSLGLQQDSNDRIELSELDSSNGTVLNIFASLNTALINSVGASDDEIPVVNNTVGNLIRISKNGNLTPYNY